MLSLVAMFALATVSGSIGEADAATAEGSPGQVSPKSYGSATSDIVCGDKLCSTPAGEADPVNEGRAQ